jgi:antitoxin component YwqK of YwqJK toxin-antitoxin module
MKNIQLLLAILVSLSSLSLFGQKVETKVDTIFETGLEKIYETTTLWGESGKFDYWSVSKVSVKKNGVLIEKYSLVRYSLDGLYESFYEDSSRKITCIFDRGVIVGQFVSYHQGGGIKSSGRYHYDLCILHNNKNLSSMTALHKTVTGPVLDYPIDHLAIKDGTWNYWAKSGELTKTEFWEMGRLVKEE